MCNQNKNHNRGTASQTPCHCLSICCRHVFFHWQLNMVPNQNPRNPMAFLSLTSLHKKPTTETMMSNHLNVYLLLCGLVLVNQIDKTPGFLVMHRDSPRCSSHKKNRAWHWYQPSWTVLASQPFFRPLITAWSDFYSTLVAIDGNRLG